MKDFFLRVLAGLILVPFSSGCSCLQSTFCETFQRADVVLKGTVFAKTRFLDETPSFLGEDELRTISLNNASILYGVFVTHVFNGKEVKRFIIVTANESSAACGVDLPFDEENLEEYVFFISGDVWSDYRINSCSSPQLWSSLSEEDLAALHEGCSSTPDECTDTKCKPFQECLVYEEEGGTSREEYCADLCDPSRCDEEQGEVCELQEVQCVRAPCPPLAVCVAPPPPPTGCTTVRCGPFQECLVDRDGNGYCADTCADGTCEEGETCELLPTPCAPGVYPCPPVATCSPTPTGCATLRCGPFQECLEDREGDPYCADTCEPGRCEEGETCELQEVQCFQEPCPPVAVCVDTPPPPTGCATIRCPPFTECLLDGSGNPYCADTCEPGKCEEGQTCELLDTPCAPGQDPCPPVAVCTDGGEVECPILCTLEYVPLCAVNPEGAFRTFGNACGLSAENKCGDVEWTLAYEGECEEPEECARICTADFVPVCAEDAATDTRKTFSNPCALAAENDCGEVMWTYLYEGECDSDSHE